MGNTLPETNIAPERWMVGRLSRFLLGPSFLAGAMLAMLVSGRVLLQRVHVYFYMLVCHLSSPTPTHCHRKSRCHGKPCSPVPTWLGTVDSSGFRPTSQNRSLKMKLFFHDVPSCEFLGNWISVSIKL